MPIALPTEIRDLLDRRNFVHLATVMRDGSPHSAPVWVGREGDRLIICTDEGSLKGKNTLRDARCHLGKFIRQVTNLKERPHQGQ